MQGPPVRLTFRQLKLMRFLDETHGRTGKAPSIKEVKDEFGIRSNNGVVDHYDRLQMKGVLLRHKYQARATEITDLGKQTLAYYADVAETYEEA